MRTSMQGQNSWLVNYVQQVVHMFERVVAGFFLLIFFSSKITNVY